MRMYVSMYVCMYVYVCIVVYIIDITHVNSVCLSAHFAENPRCLSACMCSYAYVYTCVCIYVYVYPMVNSTNIAFVNSVCPFEHFAEIYAILLRIRIHVNHSGITYVYMSVNKCLYICIHI